MPYFYHFKYDFSSIFSPNLLKSLLISSPPISSYLLSLHLIPPLLILSLLSLFFLSLISPLFFLFLHLILSFLFLSLLFLSPLISSSRLSSPLLLSIDVLGEREVAPRRPGVRSEEKNDDYETTATAGTLLSAYVFLMYLYVCFRTILKSYLSHITSYHIMV